MNEALALLGLDIVKSLLQTLTTSYAASTPIGDILADLAKLDALKTNDAAADAAEKAKFPEAP